jgi:PAS domain S-box-containing protein
MAEGTHEAFWLFGLETNEFLYISPAFEAIWGRTPASLYAAPGDWLDAIHPDDRPRFGPASIASRTTGPSDEEYRIVRPDGEVRFIRERSFPIRDGSGRVYRIAAIAEDITDRRRLELELRQAQKMEAIGTLAGGIAHDFNNILAAIVGYTELATMDAEGNPRVLKSLTAVKTASQRATDLVRQILTFSRKEEQQRQHIQLAPVVNDALKMLRASLPSSIEIRTNFAADTPPVLADSTQIHQVIMNLGTNAWHAMQDGVGMLEVTLGAFDVDVDFARTRIELKPGPHALLSIRDTGCGMDRATQERIFDPFFTTKEPGQGTGLGLAMVHGIVKNHDGAVSVYSQPGQGATFNVYFPASTLVPAAADVKAKAVPRGDGQRILFVDDEVSLVTWGEQALQRLGYRVTPFTSAVDALAAVMDRPDGFDLVVTDLTMPEIDGIKLAQQLKSVRPGLPVILATGHSATLTSESARQFGIRDLLLKPVTLRALGEAVHRVLSKKEKESADVNDLHLVGG